MKALKTLMDKTDRVHIKGGGTDLLSPSRASAR